MTEAQAAARGSGTIGPLSLRLDELVCASLIAAPGAPAKVEEVRPAFAGISLHVARAADVLYLPELGLQVVAGRLVPQEAIHTPWALDFERQRDFEGLAAAYRAPFSCGYVDSEACVLANLYSPNFHHWVTEELPKVIILERCGFSGVYLTPNIPDFGRQFLRLLGVGDERIVSDLAGPVLLRSGVFTTAIDADKIVEHAPVFYELRARLADATGPEVAPLGSRLWLDRGLGVRNPGRDLVNAEEVFAVLNRYGFAMIDMASLPVRAQLAAAQQAAMLAGVHGAGFVHSLFMPPRSVVVECFSPNFINPGILSICHVLRHRYSMIAHPNAYGAYPYGDRLFVNCVHLDVVLRSFVEDQASA